MRSPSLLRISITAKNVLSRKLVTTTRSTRTPSSTIRLRKRSCVIGRGGACFSISKAIAFASYAPTQIGSIVSLWTSFKIIIGVPLLGSIINARILTSISIRWYPLRYCLTFRIIILILSQSCIQTIRLRFRDDNVDDLTFETAITLEVNYLMTSRVPRQITCGSRTLSLSQHAQLAPHV